MIDTYLLSMVWMFTPGKHLLKLPQPKLSTLNLYLAIRNWLNETHRKFWQVLLKVFFTSVQQRGQRCPQHPGEDLQLLTSCGHAGDLTLITCIWYQLKTHTHKMYMRCVSNMFCLRVVSLDLHIYICQNQSSIPILYVCYLLNVCCL